MMEFKKPNRLPDMELVGYLKRWVLVPRNKVCNVYLHEFLGPDEPILHDHPWNFTSTIVHGNMVEAFPDGENALLYGDMYHRRMHDLHYIKEVEPGTLTIVVTGPVARSWGFVVEGGRWIDHKIFKGREVEIINRNGYRTGETLL